MSKRRKTYRTVYKYDRVYWLAIGSGMAALLIFIMMLLSLMVGVLLNGEINLPSPVLVWPLLACSGVSAVSYLRYRQKYQRSPVYGIKQKGYTPY